MVIGTFKFQIEFDNELVIIQDEEIQITDDCVKVKANNEDGVLFITIQIIATTGDSSKKIAQDKLAYWLRCLIYEYDCFFSDPVMIESNIKEENQNHATNSISGFVKVSRPQDKKKLKIRDIIFKKESTLQSRYITLYSATLKMTDPSASFEILYATLYSIKGNQKKVDIWLNKMCKVPLNHKRLDLETKKYVPATIFTQLRNEIHHMDKKWKMNSGNTNIERTLHLIRENHKEFRDYVKRAIEEVR